MSRANRMQPVQSVVDEKERQRAEALAGGEQRVVSCEKRLAELTKYEADYRRNYQERVKKGMTSAELRDYQVFLARLAEAVRQQGQVVEKARQDRDVQRSHWQQAAQRSKAVETVIDQWRAEDRRNADRKEQRESDERAQGAFQRQKSDRES